MSILQADGIQFSDGSVLNSFYGIIPQGKKLVFYQAAAPVGWSKTTTANDDASMLTDQSIDNVSIRVVSGSSGGQVYTDFGGQPNFTTAMPTTPKSFDPFPAGRITQFQGTVEPHTLITDEIPGHSHEIGSREVDDEPPAPTSYQATLQRSYADRSPTNLQTAYQQPVVYQQPVIYQQPSAYQQPANRQATQPIQNPSTYQQPTNPNQRITGQQPASTNQRVNVTQNRNDRVRQRNPVSNSARNRNSTQVNRQASNPVNRRNRNNARQRNPASQPNPQTRNDRQNRNERVRVRRRNRRGRRRNRRRGRANRSRRAPVSRSVQITNNVRRRVNVRRRNPNSTQVQSPNTTPVNRQNPVNVNSRVRLRTPQQRSAQIQQPNPVNRQTSIQNPNPNPIQNPTPLRTPTTVQQPNTTRVTANTRVNAAKRVNANTNQPVTVPSNVQNPVVNYSPYPQPLIVPGDTIRGDNTDAPDTALVGSNQAHTHPFTGGDIAPQLAAPSGLSFQVQYIDVIICSLD